LGKTSSADFPLSDLLDREINRKIKIAFPIVVTPLSL